VVAHAREISELIKRFSMKRNAASLANGGPTKKKPRVEVPEYHSTPCLRDDAGEIVWPAPEDKIEEAREFIRQWLVLCQY
jgi:hypothetical protein